MQTLQGYWQTHSIEITLAVCTTILAAKVQVIIDTLLYVARV